MSRYEWQAIDGGKRMRRIIRPQHYPATRKSDAERTAADTAALAAAEAKRARRRLHQTTQREAA